MKKKKSKPVSANAVGRYAKARLGYGGAKGVSMYELASRALAIDGKAKPEGCGFREWVYQNAEFINASAPQRKRKTYGTPPVLSAVPTSARWTAKASIPVFQGSGRVDVRSADFLQSYEWRVLRMQALKLHGPRCQCCGATPADGVVMNVDHIKPRRLFPELALTLDNLQILCGPCNHGKSNWDQTDWRQEPDLEDLEPEQRAHLRAIA
jgi:5-methylcytosine-specific restriction endonuclease McrA